MLRSTNMHSNWRAHFTDHQWRWWKQNDYFRWQLFIGRKLLAQWTTTPSHGASKVFRQGNCSQEHEEEKIENSIISAYSVANVNLKLEIRARYCFLLAMETDNLAWEVPYRVIETSEDSALVTLILKKNERSLSHRGSVELARTNSKRAKH